MGNVINTFSEYETERIIDNVYEARNIYRSFENKTKELSTLTQALRSGMISDLYWYVDHMKRETISCTFDGLTLYYYTNIPHKIVHQYKGTKTCTKFDDSIFRDYMLILRANNKIPYRTVERGDADGKCEILVGHF